MKHTVDTSVIVAAFASWHEHHASAVAAIARADVVIAHCLLETYSVLTRLPPPHRMTPDVVAAYVRLSFARHPLVALSATDQKKLLATCAAQGIAGGAVYDAAIAASAARASAKLLTLDARARATYAAIGVEHQLLA